MTKLHRRVTAIPVCIYAFAMSSGAWSADTARGSCAALAKFSMPGENLAIEQAEPVAADARKSVPAHCRVTGVLDRRTGRAGQSFGIGFAVALPEKWNGGFLFQGGGGLNGSIAPP